MNTAAHQPIEPLGPRAIAYVASVAVVGLGTGLAVLSAGPLRAETELLILCGLAAVLGSRTVRLWSTVELSVALPFIYAALLIYGAPAATLVSLLAALGACLIRPKRLSLSRVLFNTAVIAGTTAVSARSYLWLGGPIGDVTVTESFWPLAASTLVYYALNTALISGIIHLTRGIPLLKVWKENFVWSAPSYFTGSMIGLMIDLLLSRFGLIAFAVAMPPSVLTYLFFRTYMERMELQRRHIEQIEAMNRELESKVAERTRELSEVNRKLEQSNEELRTSNRLKSQFLANMSHELRTPLNAIIGFSELLTVDSRRPLAGEQREYARDILSSGKHLLELINDVLDLSKIEAGKMDLSQEDFQVEEAVEAALVMIKPCAAAKRILLTEVVPAELPPLKADLSKVKQILYNLLSNAVKFTPEDGRVEVRAECLAGWFQISVSDTGIGIAEEDSERIFSEFLQLDGSYARKYQGTGLGLALVKRFVEMHSGRIWVDSAPGRGSRFTFVLPSAGAPESSGVHHIVRQKTTDVGAPTQGVSDRARTILVVEDSPLNAKLVRRVLQESGHRVVEARSAREAMEKAHAARPDLILMDLQLPDMDGLEATRTLKADPLTCGIPTVALTAHVMKGDDERAREAGCCGYIPKPIDVARFPAIVEAFLTKETAA